MVSFIPMPDVKRWFIPKPLDRKGREVIELNIKNLEDDKFYLIFPARPRKELLIAVALKCLILDESSPYGCVGEHVYFSSLNFKKISLAVVSFPLALLSECARVAAMFNMTGVNIPQEIIFSDISLILKIPPCDKVLKIKGGCEGNINSIMAECQQIIRIKNFSLKVLNFSFEEEEVGDFDESESKEEKTQLSPEVKKQGPQADKTAHPKTNSKSQRKRPSKLLRKETKGAQTVLLPKGKGKMKQGVPTKAIIKSGKK